jgi:hypothetical protein
MIHTHQDDCELNRTTGKNKKNRIKQNLFFPVFLFSPVLLNNPAVFCHLRHPSERMIQTVKP